MASLKVQTPPADPPLALFTVMVAANTGGVLKASATAAAKARRRPGNV
jgi:hypothetical protein